MAMHPGQHNTEQQIARLNDVTEVQQTTDEACSEFHDEMVLGNI